MRVNVAVDRGNVRKGVGRSSLSDDGLRNVLIPFESKQFFASKNANLIRAIELSFNRLRQIGNDLLESYDTVGNLFNARHSED